MDIKSEKEGDNTSTINGINVMRISSRDAYRFTLQLMDVLFMKEELASSLIFQSKKSDKPALDPQRVQQLLNFVDKWYADNWDLKTLTEL